MNQTTKRSTEPHNKAALQVVARGIAAGQAGQLDEAVRFFHHALSIDPKLFEAHLNLATAYLRLGKLQEAETHLTHARQLNPNDVDVHKKLEYVHRKQGDEPRCLEDVREIVRLDPENAAARNDLGKLLLDNGQPVEAIAQFEEALRLRRDDTIAQNNLGAALLAVERIKEAVGCFRRVIDSDPALLEAHVNLANALGAQGEVEEALHRLDKALSINPELAAAHRNRAMFRLLTGNYLEGWREYEWRLQCEDMALPPLSQPVWDGSPLDGRSILLRAEQGLGDLIQFVRYASLVKQRDGHVVVAAHPQLAGLIRSCPGVDEVTTDGLPVPHFDLQIPTLSLPAIFATTLETIPADIPYVSVEPRLLRYWRDRVEQIPGFKIGIAWQGRRSHPHDKYRSVALRQMQPLALLPNVTLVSLQKGDGSEQLRDVSDWGVVDLVSDCQTFLDTAAVVSQLDLVVTVDTAVAHLAGALGVRTWVAIPSIPDWRWLLKRQDSPWYPTTRLFRQSSRGDWEPVFARMAEEATSLVAAKQPLATKTPPVSAEDSGLVTFLATQGAVAAERNKLEEAEAFFRQTLHLEPSYAEAYLNLGTVHSRRSRHDEALSCYQKALELEPNSSFAHTKLGNLKHHLGERKEAEELFRRALELAPDDPLASANLGALLLEMRRIEDATAVLRRTVEVHPHYLPAQKNFCVALLHQGRLEEAALHIDQALETNPEDPDLLCNLASLQSEQGDESAQRQSLQKALQLQPNHPTCHKDLGMLLLRNGDFARGWPEYEWRFRCRDGPKHNFAQPMWNGENLRGKTLLLVAEQGLGDTIQFLRFARNARQRGGRVVLRCPGTLTDLAKTCPDIEQVVSNEAPTPHFDCFAHLMSLPRILNISLDNVPAEVPYLHVPADLKGHWQNELADVTGLKVGIAWQGSQLHPRDWRRSVPLRTFAPLAELPEVQLVVLQQQHGREQLGEWKAAWNLIDPGNSKTFLETAALISSLDLVVTVDSAVAHLSGALAKPVWVALPWLADWRWLKSRTDSPWYPTMRLFRQSGQGNWQNVFERLAEALRDFSASWRPAEQRDQKTKHTP